jgi:hypothetical protein
MDRADTEPRSVRTFPSLSTYVVSGVPAGVRGAVSRTSAYLARMSYAASVD